MQSTLKVSQGIKSRTFFTESGAQEYFLSVSATEGLPLQAALDEIDNLYKAALLEYDLGDRTLQFARFYFSDITNDYPFLKNSSLFYRVSQGAVSFVQQRPLDGSPIALFAYHIKTADNPFGQSVYKHTKSQLSREVFTTGRNYSLLWTTNCTDCSAMDSRIQTDKIFDGLNSVLDRHQMDLRQNMVRTWIYVRDVDNNYAGMVKSRCELFDNIGLTAQTRYIASTGIEGKTFNPGNLVTLDSLSIGNLKEEQIIKMEALENLSSTAAYGVTFERGLRIRFGDRSHLYISGTASIDNCGNIMYEGDVRKQLERTLDNVEALLAPHGATMNDMQYILLYLRNPGHISLISDILSNRIPEGLPLIALEGPVCRPGWLVEVEGVGIIPDSCAFPDFI